MFLHLVVMDTNTFTEICIKFLITDLKIYQIEFYSILQFAAAGVVSSYFGVPGI